jgi:prepilin-type N-terminal cleavage/methylation domain-containing protein
MRKRGFTLVEMLAVVIIMGLVIIVALPQIQNLTASKRGAISDTAKQMLYDAADSYTSGDTNTYQKLYIGPEERASYCITIKELIDAGKIEEEKLQDYIDYGKTEEEKKNFLKRIIYATTNEFNEFEYVLSEDIECTNATDVNKEPKPSYKDNTLQDGIYPSLVDGLVPVVYREDKGYWVIADKTTAWYNYGEKKWANAMTFSKNKSDCESRQGVTCLDGNAKHARSYYQRAVPGTKISLDDVTGMYVWIPRYEYKQEGNGFAIRFIKTTQTSPTSGYRIHPAFQFGGKQLEGMWVAKFEASAPINTSCFQTPDIASCNKTHIDLVTVPGRNSWSGISLANAFKVTQNMATSTDSFGLNSAQVDTHLMKNVEWGAVAYLTDSNYGKKEEIWLNNYYNRGTITGCTSGNAGGSVSTECKNNYASQASMSGTTSGNITGIYDMSGGYEEFVMAYNGTSLNLGGTAIDNKYVDYYPNKACLNTEANCAGGALFGKYEDKHNMVDATNKYMVRGGNYSGNTTSGLYAYDRTNGSANLKIGFRPVITIK